MNNTQQRKIFLILSLLLGAGIHFYFQSNILNIDELNSIYKSDPTKALSDIILKESKNHPFGYYLLLWISNHFLGLSLLSLKILSFTAISTIQFILGLEIINKIKDRKVMLIGLLILATLPMFTQLSSFVRSYAFFPLLGHLILEKTIDLEKDLSHKNIGLFSLYSLILCLFHYIGLIFVLSSLFVLVIKYWKKVNKVFIYGSIASLFIIGWQYSYFFRKFKHLRWGLKWLTPEYTAKLFPFFFKSNFFYHEVWLSLPLFGLILYFIVNYFKENSFKQSKLFHHFLIFSAIILCASIIRFVYRVELLYLYSGTMILFFLKQLDQSQKVLKGFVAVVIIIGSIFSYRTYTHFFNIFYEPHNQFKLFIHPYKQALKLDKKPPFVIMSGELRCKYFRLYAKTLSIEINNFYCVPNARGAKLQELTVKNMSAYKQTLGDREPKTTLIFSIKGLSTQEMFLMKRFENLYKDKIEFQKEFPTHFMTVIRH